MHKYYPYRKLRGYMVFGSMKINFVFFCFLAEMNRWIFKEERIDDFVGVEKPKTYFSVSVKVESVNFGHSRIILYNYSLDFIYFGAKCLYNLIHIYNIEADIVIFSFTSTSYVFLKSLFFFGFNVNIFLKSYFLVFSFYFLCIVLK